MVRTGFEGRKSKASAVKSRFEEVIRFGDPGRGSHQGCSFMKGAGDWLSACRRCSMIRIGRGCVEGRCGFPINDIGTSLRLGRGVGGDDTADCLRYLVATKTRSVLTRKLRGL